MKSQNLKSIKNQSDRLLVYLNKKYSPKLKNLSFSSVSLEDFRPEKRYFTKDELLYCKNRISSLAGRFVAKLAIRKTLQKNIPWNEMNILSSQNGQPFLPFPSKVCLSISHDRNLVAALAAGTSQTAIKVGIDIGSISRVNGLYSQTRVLQKIFTPSEMVEIENFPEKIAEKWTGKEAVSKAIGVGIWHGALLHDIEIITTNKKPFVKLTGKVFKQAAAKSLSNWEIAFIKDQNFILAFAVATN